MVNIKMKCLLAVLAVLLVIVNAHGPGPGYWPQRRRSSNETASMQSRAVDTTVHFEVAEGEPSNTLVGFIPTKPGFRYRFNEPLREFSLDPVTGEIRTNSELDRESLVSDHYDLVILSSQPTYPIEVRIYVLDVNDNSPHFPEPVIAVTFSESNPPGTRILLDAATDADIGVNSVTDDYQIIGGNDEGKFRLAVTTNPSGDVSYLHLETTGSLDRESRAFYVLNISAKDGGIPQHMGYLQVNVTVLDVNDNPPIFDHSDYIVSLNESVLPGTHVLQVMATDSDLGENAKIVYYLADTESQFAVDPETGHIRTVDKISCPLQDCPEFGASRTQCHKSCVFTVFARDHGSPRQDGRTYVTINLLDTNDHDPAIKFQYFPSTSSHATVDENAANGTVVAAISVDDMDEGPNGRTSLEIVAGNEQGHFRLEATTSFYLVRVNSVLDREEINKYNLTVVAVDDGTPQRTTIAHLIILVNDVNDHEPVFEKSEYSVTLSELVPPGSFVASIVAKDEDTGVNAQVLYSFVSGNQQNWFSIIQESGLIMTNAVLDREQQDTILLNISAHDGGPNPKYAFAQLKITLLDENDEAPKFVKADVVMNLPEDAPAGSHVATLTAFDADQGTNGSVTYELTNFQKVFSLDSNTGRLITAQPLDRETVSRYDIRVVARDHGTPAQQSEARISLLVNDINDNTPIFYPHTYYTILDDDSEVGASIAKISAHDPDEGFNSLLKYSIQSGDDTSLFALNSSTGLLTLKTKISNYPGSSYDLIFSVIDGGNRRAKRSASLKIIKKSKAKIIDMPVVYEFEVSENDLANVGNLWSDEVAFFIVDGDLQESFRIEKGILSLVKPLDREMSSLYNLQVVANDGLYYGVTRVLVKVLDVNDNAPTFKKTLDKVLIDEDTAVGALLYDAKAVDADESEVTYSLQGSVGKIDHNGLIILNRPIREDPGTELKLEISATDGQFTSSMTLLIVVRDVNDHTPIFDHTTYETSLIESTSVNTRFFALMASDADQGENSRVVFEIMEGNSEDKFGLFPDGHLYVKNALDREERSYYSLSVTCRDMGSPSRSSVVPMVIHVIDDNDNPPIFTNETFVFRIAENEPSNSFVGKLRATDRDVGRNAELIYMIADLQSDFMVDPRNGFIKTLKSFDRELLMEQGGEEIEFNVVVTDNGENARLRDRAKVKVIITDMNDNAPQFLRAPYRIQVSEGAKIGSQLLKIHTTDADSGENSVVTYKLKGPSDNFAVENGAIVLMKPLDREMTDKFTITVVAENSHARNKLQNETTVSIEVLDENDNAPEFAHTTTFASIEENRPVGTEIIRFRALDTDSGDNARLHFAIFSGNKRDAFVINSKTGVVSLNRPLDYEDTAVYQLNITCSDYGQPPLVSSLLFKIYVIDVNDNPPNFPSTAIVRQIREGITIGTKIVTVLAEDPDSGVNGKIRYSIVMQEPADGYFAINFTSGIIHTLRAIDRESIDTFKITVRAVDQGTPSLSAKKLVTVIVEDVNDNAPQFTSMNTAIVESAEAESVIQVSARDLDSSTNGLVSFEIVTGDASIFSISRNTGVLTLRKPLPGGRGRKFELMVRATDEAAQNERKSTDSYLTVFRVGDEGERPVFEQHSLAGSVYENEPIGTSILKVTAKGKNVEYYVTNVTRNGRQMERLFDISQGVLSTANIIDREAGDSYDVEISAVSMGDVITTTKTTIKIQILDRNDCAPRFDSNRLEFNTNEDALVGHIVGKISAIDEDTFGTLTYSIISGGGDLFSIDTTDGSLKLADTLDREQNDEHEFIVQVSDGSHFSNATIVVKVTDANDNAPIFEKLTYSFEVPENATRGFKVGGIRATDRDIGANAQISYNVVSNWANDVFTLDPTSGLFTLISNLDYEEVPHYILIVQAQDAGTPQLTSTATVYCNVLDLNDNAPLFNQKSFFSEILENTPIGSEVLVVSASDADSGENGRINFSIVEGDEEQQFEIFESGSIKTVKMLDRETRASYNLVVQIEDNGAERLSSTTQVTITLKDINDQSPEFTSMNEVYVMENSPVNTIVTVVMAFDRDEGTNSRVTYSLASDVPVPFTLGSIDGVLKVAGPLDRELRSGYEVQVTARDGGAPALATTLNLTVNILDENDNSPVFDPRQYSAAIAENASIGASVMQVSATDTDEGANGQIRYSIISGDENQDFSISEDTGVVRVARNINYERKSRYNLVVKAEDRANDVGKFEARYDTADLIILITDINDNAPTFYDSPYMAYVMEDTQLPNEGYFLTVTALDADTPPLNNQVRYFLKEGNADLFYVNASTGDISLRTTLDREQAYEHVLTIIAMDTGSPPLTGTGTVLVSVMDINDNKPEFEKKEYSAKVMENIDIGTEVLRVIATDKDAGLNGVVRYKLTGKYSERFSIDSRGFIKTAAEIDREEIGSYDLEIKASDSSATCQLKSSVSLKIIVEDVNDNSPHFPRDLYKIYIPNQGRDHFVFGAHAIDPDEDKKLKYSISGPDADSFYLEDDSIVRTKAPGGHKELLLTVTASDKDNRSASTTLSVFFFPAHLFPVFQSNQRRQFTFPENIPSSKSFATITASSPKSGKAGKISYSVASGEAVSISPNGELMIRDEVGLDFETSQIYTIWIAASDSDEPSLRSIQSFQINVTDINDNAPVVITPSLVTVPEGEGPTRLATVASTDADTGENAEITFSLLDDFDSFEIDEVSGELTTVTRLDREEHEKYELVVLATDHGEPRLTGSSTIVVQVLDKNDNPPKFSRLFSVNVTENANIGSFVVRVTSIDLDSPENAQVRYSFAENIDKKFKIDPISGNVTVNGALDREQQEEYILKVMASDGAWRAETPLTITIQDQNDNAPEFEHSYYSFNFPEFQKKSAFVGQVIATDRDKVGPNSVISYSLQKPSDIFTIDPATGEMYSKRTLHYKHTEFSPENIYSFLVLATDNGKPPMQSECLVNVNIIDANNNAPVFGKRSYMAPVPLGAKYGQKVLQVEAKDTADFGVNAEISYQIVGGNGSNYFNINHNDGWISTTRQISVALGERFILSVKAFDRGIPPQYDEVIVTIIATGENRHSPVFTALSYQVIVPENEPMGSSILNVKATDVDDGLNGLVSYSISAGNERGEFEIATNGSITIAQALDFEAMPEYYLNITASDMGFLPRKTVAMLKVTLTDINDNAPTFPKPEYHAYLVENSPVNSTVLQIRATDRDSPKNAHVEYLLPKTGLFFIEKNTGVIRSRVVFDFEEESSYEIQVMAQNPGSPTMTGTTKVIVHITGVNEFVPKFVQSVFHFDVSESTEIGSAIGVIKATDADHGADGKIYYLLVGSSQEKGFSVNRDTGEIKISRHLDRETQSRVVLTVMAKNFGSIQGNDTDEAQVIISIQDGNDPPAFEKSIYRVSVSEDAAKGTEVLQVSASDTDLKPQNNQFSFRILDGNINETFHVDSDGIIRTRKLLDRETIPHYTLLVGAIDTGVPPATGTATVLLDVTDVNDNGPMFEPENLIGYVTENEPAGTSIMTLNAYDIDIGGTPFTYRLIGGTHQQLVTLDPAGLLKTSRPLDRERIQELSLIVEVEDSGGMRSQHKVVVHVEDQNDSPSTNRHVKVLALVYKGHILPDTVLADVRPNDPDTTGDYRCKLADSRAFRIKNACFLSTTGSTQLKNYTLSVTGNDGRHANVVSTIEITFSKFNEKHVENAIIVRVEEMTADDFLTSYFQTFVNLVKMITGRLTIFSIREETDGVEIFLSIEEKSAATVSEALTKKYDQLVEQLHKKVIVGYSKCSKVGQCENEGVCRSKIIVQHNELITVSSESLILTSPRAETHFECVCTDGFIGDRCEKRLNPCNPNPCQAGGQCRHQGYDFQCYCPPDRDGKLCEIKKSNMCLENPCQNGGSCHADGTNFFCLCRTGYRGSRCEFVVDTCRPNPCMNGGKCVALKPGYKCSCATGFYGPTCDQRTFAFNELSFLEFPSLEPSTNDIAIVFATTKPNVLLAYNFGMAIGGRSDFVALELIAGKAVFSFGGAQTAITSLVVGRNGETFADGKWHKIIATRNGKVVSLSVSACKSGEDSCEECRVGDEKCYTDDIGPASTLNFNKNSLFIGGLASAEPILERPGQIHTDDFIGCVQSISINGRFMDLTSALHSENVEGKCSRPEAGLCSSSSCGNFPCIDRWSKTMCNCGDGSLAPNCQSAIEPVSFSEGNFLEMKVSAKHQRMQLLNSIYTENAWTHKLRRRRATNSTMRWHLDRDVAPKTLSLTFKTVKPNGVLFFAATGKYFTLVEVQEGQLAYHSVNQGGIVLKFRDEKGKGVADGAWHTMKLTMNQEGFGFWLDKRKLKDNDDVHDFLDPYLTEIFLGGVLSDDLPVGVEVIAFEGCMANFTVQNEIQPFEGDGSIFKTSTQHGKIYRGCFDLVKLGSSQVTDPLSVGLSLVIGFVIILLVATAVSFLFFKFHKHQREKSGPPVAHKQGSALLSGEMGRVHGMNDVLSHGDFRSTHHFVGPEIISKKYKDREVASIDSGTQRSQRPDIIEREVVKTASLQRGGDEHQRSLPPHEHTTSNLELEEFNEHYDLDNTNSIAPYHYKGYRDGGAPVRKFKASPLSMPGYHHKHTQQQHRHSPHHPPGPFRVPPQQSSVNNSRPPHQSTPLARLSPSSELSSQHPRILTLHDISGKPLQSALLATTSSSGGVGKDVLHSNSERSLNSPVMSQLSAESSSASRKPPKPAPSDMLTAEELERLNVRPRTSSLVSTLDAVSCSSERVGVGGPSHHLHHSQNVDASSTSSDESGNDSFTCSEIEYDNNSINGDSSSKYKSDSMPQNDCGTEAASNKPESTYDGFDSSFRGSLSTLVASDDDLSSHIGNIYRQPAPGAPTEPMGWEYLLNWGPNFESLVGVFKDIAELPDTANGVNALRLANSHPKPSEEYV